MVANRNFLHKLGDKWNSAGSAISGYYNRNKRWIVPSAFGLTLATGLLTGALIFHKPAPRRAPVLQPTVGIVTDVPTSTLVGILATSTPTPSLVWTNTPSPTLVQPSDTPQPTYTPSATPTNTLAPTNTASPTATSTAVPHDYCQNLKIQLGGRRLTSYADLNAAVNELLVPFNYGPHTIKDVILYADGRIQADVQLANGTDVFPIINVDPSQMAGYLTEIGGPKARPVVLDKAEIGTAYSGLSDILRAGKIISANQAAHQLGTSEISDLVANLETTLKQVNFVNISYNLGNPVVAIGDQDDVYVDAATYNNILVFLGMTGNCGYNP